MLRDHDRGRDRTWTALPAILLAMALGGCFAARYEGLTPTVAGVVSGFDRLAGQKAEFHLSSGEVVDVDLGTVRFISPDGGPRLGDLLLSGTDALGRTWIVGLYPYEAADAPPGCFRLLATGVGVDGSIDLSIGVRLRKAPSFDPGPVSNDRYHFDGVSFCVNGTGEVLSYG